LILLDFSPDAVKSTNWRLSSRKTIKQVFFITEETQLLGIYAMLTYILITFPRNAYYSNSFSKNSLVGVNVLPSLGGLEIILQPPYLCSLQYFFSQGLKRLFRSPLSCNSPNYSQRTETCFGCAIIL